MIESTIHYSGSPTNLKFISDTHFYHFNIINYCKRPFIDVIEMNEFIVKEWNKRVGEKDTVIFLGDFSWAGTIKNKEIFNSLNGLNKFAVKGNHDKSLNWLKNSGFTEAFDLLHIVTPEETIHCSHRYKNPNFWHQIKYMFRIKPHHVYVHGHAHNYRPFYSGEYPMFNMSCEAVRYIPVSLQEIRELMRQKPYLTFYHPFQRSTYVKED